MEPHENLSCQELLKDSPRFHGHVMKESRNRLKPVNQRYLVLHKGCLYYYKDFNKSSPKGSFSLEGYSAAKGIEWRNQPWPFIVRNTDIEKKAYVFACSTEEKRDNWVDEINKEVSTDENCYNYATEPVSIAFGENTTYEPMANDPFEESFKGPSLFSVSPPTPNTLTKPPVIPRRSSSPQVLIPDLDNTKPREAKTLPASTKPPIAARHKTSVTDNDIQPERRKKPSYEFTSIITKEQCDAPHSSEDDSNFTSDINPAGRGVPDGETCPKTYQEVKMQTERPESEVLPSSAVLAGVDRQGSEALLRSCEVSGTYLLRKDRSKENDVLTVVFDGELYHYKVFTGKDGNFHLDKKHPSFDKLCELINYYYNNSLPTYDGCLSTPYC